MEISIKLKMMIILCFVLSVLACKKDKEPADNIYNNIKYTITIEANKDKVISGMYLDLKCITNIDTSSNVNYEWTCNSGEFGTYSSNSFEINNGLDSNIIVWHAPYQIGNYNINCKVTNLSNNIVENVSLQTTVFKPVYSNTKLIYSNPRLINDLVIVNKDSIFTINIAFFNTDGTAKLLNDECILINNSGGMNFLDMSFSDNFLSYSNSFMPNVEIDNLVGKQIHELRVKMEKFGDYIYVSNFFQMTLSFAINLRTGFLTQTSLDFNYCKLLDLKANKNNNQLYGITSPRYENSMQTEPPRIWNFKENGISEIFYEFPDGYVYGGGSTGNGYPIDFKYDLAFDSKNNTYIAMPFVGKIFKLDSNKVLTIFRDDIVNPYSIAIADNDFMYIATQDEIFYLDENGNSVSVAQIDNGEPYNYNAYQSDIDLDEEFNVYYINSRFGTIQMYN